MQVTNLKCQNCGSNDFVKISETQYECTYCGTTNMVQPDQIRTTINLGDFSKQFEGTAQASKKLSRIIVGVIVATTLGGLAFTFLITSSVTSTIADVDKTISKTLENTGVAGNPDVVINGKSYQDNLGKSDNHPDMKVKLLKTVSTKDRQAEWYMVENKSTSIWWMPSLNVDYYDANDIKLNSGWGNTSLSMLLPGQKVIFKIDFFGDEPPAKSVVKCPSNGFSYASNREYGKIDIEQVELKKSGSNNYELKGIVINTSGSKASLTIFVNLKNKAGDYIGTASGSPTGGLMDPNGKAKFTLYFSTPDSFMGPTFATIYDEPASWEFFYESSLQ